MRFIIVNELPYLLSHGKAYKVRMDEKSITVGECAEIAQIPAVTYSELSMRAKCAILDSIGQQEEQAEEPEQEQQEEQAEEPEKTAENEEEPKKRGRKKTAEK